MSGTTPSPGVRQYLRKFSLIIASPNGQDALEFSAFHVRFTIEAALISRPNTALARIYNVKKDTARKLMDQKNFPEIRVGQTPQASPSVKQQVAELVIRAGYEGNFGILFRGYIMQIKWGRESPADTYIDVLAADSDFGHNWAFVNTTLASGYTHKDALEKISNSYSSYGVDKGELPTDVPDRSAPRGLTMFGQARDFAQQHATDLGVDFFYYQNTLNWLPTSAYLPGEPATITGATGMIGLPEQTNFGVTVRMLINPSVGPGKKLLIKQDSIQLRQFSTEFGASNANAFFVGPNQQNAAPGAVSMISANGEYRTLAVSHIGDTRGNEWYTDAVCVDASPAGAAGKGTTDYPTTYRDVALF